MLDFLLSAPSLISLVGSALLAVPFAVGLVSTSNGETIATRSILEGVKRVKLPQGRYEALELEITADNQTGESVTFDDLGSLRVLRQGDDQFQTYDNMNTQAQIFDEFSLSGPTRDTTDGGTSTLRTKITQRLPLLAPINALHVPDDEETTLVLNFDSSPGGGSGLNSLANSGQVKVIGYQNPAVAEQRSVKFERTSPQFAGSGQSEIENVTGENVAFIFVNDPDDVVEAVSITRKMPGGLSNEKLWDEAPIDRAQRAYEDIDRDFGASSLYGIMVPASPASQDIRNLGVDMELTVSGGSSALDVVYARVDDPVATGSVAGVQQRARTLGNA